MSALRLEFSQMSYKQRTLGSREPQLVNKHRVCLCGSRYLRECVKEISDHFQGGLSPGLMFITRVRTLEGLVSNFKIYQ